MKILRTSPENNHQIYITNLCCSSEEALIRGKLESIPGILDLKFDVVSHQMNVRHTIDPPIILKALQTIGMNGVIIAKKLPALPPLISRQQIFTVCAAGLLLLTGEILNFKHVNSTMTEIVLLFSILVGGRNIFSRALRSAKHLSLDINLLMTVAAIGAVAIGQPGEGAAVIFLFALSLLIESKSLDRTRKAFETLMNLAPQTALVKSDRGEVLRSIEEIFLNDVVIVKPGDRIPVDGIVCHGLSTVDQSTITGEPFPKVKKTGDAAYAGTFNQQGTLEIRVTRLSSDSILSKVTHLVQEGQSKRALTQTSIERFATYYTPAVFVAAIFLCAIPVFVFLQPFHVWLYRSLVLLVVSCPCALVISTPITIVSALTNAARNGVLIKGGIHLEELSRIHCVAFDKTGTLTLGRPKITSVHSLNSMSAGQIVQIAVALEKRSEHPFAEAFLEYATSNKIPISDYGITDFCAIPGKGIQAMIDHERYFLGSHQFVEDLGVCSSKVEELVDKFQHDDASTVFLANERKILGVFAVEDEVRLQGMNSIRSLHALGIKRTVLLTGDDSTQSATLQRQLSIDELRSGLLPGEKVSAIRDLQRQYGEVAMVGDGINDAPALANASIGIAMGGAGSDIALETADVVLMNDDLTKLPFALRLGKRALSTIKQNIVFALTIKAIFIGLGAFGITSLWLAILADDGVTLLVALNGMRLLRMR